MWQFLSRTVIDTNVRKSQKRHEKTRYFYPVFGGFFVTIENIPTPKNSRMYVSLLSTVEELGKPLSRPPMHLNAASGRAIEFQNFNSSVSQGFFLLEKLKYFDLL